MLCGDAVEREMWTAVLHETIAVREEAASPNGSRPKASAGVGVMDVDPDVEQTLRAALAGEELSARGAE